VGRANARGRSRRIVAWYIILQDNRSQQFYLTLLSNVNRLLTTPPQPPRAAADSTALRIARGTGSISSAGRPAGWTLLAGVRPCRLMPAAGFSALSILRQSESRFHPSSVATLRAAHAVDGRDRPASSSADPPAHFPDRVDRNVPCRGSLLRARDAAGIVAPRSKQTTRRPSPAARPSLRRSMHGLAADTHEKDVRFPTAWAISGSQSGSMQG
jgi:hypothetical protein